MAKYTDTQKAEMYQSVADKLASAAGELQKFLVAEHLKAGQPIEDPEAQEVDSTVKTLSSTAGRYLVNASRLKSDASQ